MFFHHWVIVDNCNASDILLDLFILYLDQSKSEGKMYLLYQIV